jgi:hypothetical protein
MEEKEKQQWAGTVEPKIRSQNTRGEQHPGATAAVTTELVP